jgi:hypothetical protein
MNRFAALHDWPALSIRARRVLDRLVEVVGAEDDERVGAAHLEHDLLQIPAGDLGDGGAGALGAGDGTPRTRGSAITHSICSFVA